MVTIITIYSILAICLVFSFWKNKQKTFKAFKIATKGFLKTAPSLFMLLGIVGLILGILTPETIERLIGEEAGFLATGVAAILGAITLIPSLIAFPLAGSLLRSGATIITISAFITSLVMVGTITAPMEIKSLGKNFTLMRNGLSFLGALFIAAIMGVFL